MSAAKDLRALARQLQREGWQRRRTGKDHIALTPPGGGRPLVLSNTPSRSQAVTKAKADLTRLRGGGRR